MQPAVRQVDVVVVGRVHAQPGARSAEVRRGEHQVKHDRRAPSAQPAAHAIRRRRRPSASARSRRRGAPVINGHQRHPFAGAHVDGAGGAVLSRQKGAFEEGEVLLVDDQAQIGAADGGLPRLGPRCRCRAAGARRVRTWTRASGQHVVPVDPAVAGGGMGVSIKHQKMETPGSPRTGGSSPARRRRRSPRRAGCSD